MDFVNRLQALDQKIGEGSEFNSSFDDIYFGKITEGYRNKNKFTFGYSAEALDYDNDNPDLSNHVQLGFIGGNHPCTYIIDCKDACPIDQNFKTICHTVQELVRESQTLKPFLCPPRTKRRRTKSEKKKSANLQRQEPVIKGYGSILQFATQLIQDRTWSC